MRETLLLCAKVAIFLLSNIGWWTWIYRRTKIDVHFLPSIAIMAQITILFLAGLLNMLFETAFVLYGVGLGFVVVFLLRERLGVFNHLKRPEFIAFVLCLLVMFYITRDVTIYMDDDFHHWALLVKELLRNNCYPTDNYPIVYFKSYLPGTATYIYYFCRFCDHHEFVYIWAQNYMMLCFFAPFAYINKNRNLFVYLYLLSTYGFVVYYNSSAYNLMVDTILPIAFMSSLCFLLYIADGKMAKENIAFFSFMISGLLLIKNSALYFAAVLILFVLYFIWANQSNIMKKIQETGAILLPFLLVYLWRRHCIYVFKNPDSMHTLSKAYLVSTYDEKTPAIVAEIKDKFLEFSFSGKELLCVLIGFIVLIICTRILGGKWKSTINVLLFSIVLYVTYMIGLYAMYLYSMPVTDALRLASAGRYRASILICVFLMITACISKYAAQYLIDHKASAKRMMVYMLLTAFSVLCFRTQNVFMHHPGALPSRVWLKELIETYNIRSGKSYFIVANTKDPDVNGWLLSSIVRYDLTPMEFMTAYDPTDATELKEADKYDYIILMDKDNPIVSMWVEEHYPEQVGNDVIECGVGCEK